MHDKMTYHTYMEKLIPSLPTRQLVDLGDDLTVYGQTDEDWDLFEAIVTELRRRQDYTVSLPYWAFD